MKIAIAGLNPGTAIYAQYMAKNGHEVTIFTESQNDVVIADLLPHVSLNIVNRESTRLFTRRYLEDILGIRIRNVKLQSITIDENRIILTNGEYDNYDKVIIGSEIYPASSGRCISVYSIKSLQGKYLIEGRDAGKNTELLLLIADVGGSVDTKSALVLDDDVLKSVPINRAQDAQECLSTDYEVVKPIIGKIGVNNELLGRSFVMRDSLSGIEYVVNRDYQLIIMGKLMALRDLGVINTLPLMPRLELGFSNNWSFMTIGLTREELGSVFRDLSSSRISYRAVDNDIIAKVLHRGNKLLGMQVLARGIKLLSWFYLIYSLVMLNDIAYLVLDMGYERVFGTLRGLLEQLVLNLYNI